jgi:L-alanine-DL-glutamate epimerase-like enolase superfamily enzyme
MVTTTEPIVQNGFINVPEAPGLGVELNETEVVKYLREGESLD